MSNSRTPIPLATYHRIFLTLEAPLGQFPYELEEHVEGQHTGFATHDYLLKHSRGPWVASFEGPTVAGVGPQVVASEKERLLELRKNVDQAIEELDGFLAMFKDK